MVGAEGGDGDWTFWREEALGQGKEALWQHMRGQGGQIKYVLLGESGKDTG